jgi:hypothetical protein
MTNFIVGFGADDHIYTVNGVRYVVQSRYTPVNFRNPEQNTRINSRIEKYLTRVCCPFRPFYSELKH